MKTLDITRAKELEQSMGLLSNPNAQFARQLPVQFIDAEGNEIPESKQLNKAVARIWAAKEFIYNFIEG